MGTVVAVRLKSGKNVHLPVPLNYFKVDGYDKEMLFHWFDFTKEEQKELADSIKLQYLDRNPDK